jgi:hypothetical protein
LLTKTISAVLKAEALVERKPSILASVNAQLTLTLMMAKALNYRLTMPQRAVAKLEKLTTKTWALRTAVLNTRISILRGKACTRTLNSKKLAYRWKLLPRHLKSIPTLSILRPNLNLCSAVTTELAF